MQYRILGKTGLKVSVLGFGASPLGNEFRITDPEEGKRAVHRAIDLGINYFDVAPYYGRTLAEERLGIALQGKRHQVILATKCGRYDVDKFDFSGQRVIKSCEESLRRLRTDYIDVFQAHDIEFGDRQQIIEETIPAMRKLQEQGKIRFVGITGLPLKILRDVAEKAGVDTILSYCRYNLMITDMDEILTPFCREREIGLINASPLHMGILTERGAPAWHPAPEPVKEAGRRVAELCQKRGVRVADVALRFCVAHPYVATTLVGMSRPDHVETNVAALDGETPEDLMEEIRAIIAPVFNTTWPSGRPENQDYEELRQQLLRRQATH